MNGSVAFKLYLPTATNSMYIQMFSITSFKFAINKLNLKGNFQLCTIITLPFLFRYETPYISKMCHSIKLYNVPDTPLVSYIKYYIMPTINYLLAVGDLKTFHQILKKKVTLE